MQNKNYSGRQLGPRWAAQMSSQPSYMHANIKISVGPNWAPDGLAQMGSPLGTHLKTVAKVNWAPSGLPTWGPSDSPSGPHLWPSCTCWLGTTFDRNITNFTIEAYHNTDCKLLIKSCIIYYSWTLIDLMNNHAGIINK